MEVLHKQNKLLFNVKPDKNSNIRKNYSNGLNSNKNYRISQTNLPEVCESVKSAKQVIFFFTHLNRHNTQEIMPFAETVSILVLAKPE